MKSTGSSWLKFGLFSVGLGQSFVFVIVPPLARDLGMTEIQTSLVFAFSAIAWALTSASWGRASDRYGRRNIAMLGLIGYAASLVTMITPLFLVEKNILDVVFLFPLLIFGRLLNGLLGSATRPAAFAYVADNSSRDKRTVKFARLESSFLLGTVAGPLIGGFLILITKETPFYVFSFMALIASIGIYFNIDNTSSHKKTIEPSEKISWLSKSIWPFLALASIASLTQASLLQSIGFFIFDTFSYLDDLPIIVSMSFALLSISTIVSQYLFTDAFPISNFKLLIYGSFLIMFSYITMGYFSKISIYFLSITINGLGAGMLRPALSSALSLSQTPENQGSAAGYLGSVYPIGHMLTPIIAMPIYAINPSFLYYFSSILCISLIIFIISHPIFRMNNENEKSTVNS
ncbi:MAG: MFS transporter [Gammaproteobacteria bacterium]|jgi:MFS family permease|uniref:MFS transporter n=1 Tax=SAR86 cluster bacterium TaxID=2030880 RepID=A0A520MF78_9GAMM|nr:MAG: MFS transporter [SAR86 cluster bacterium]|tara:strand:- start:1397 stop:2608 length:1212 start_codon:yes stop_codon:yes gene_type:complete